MTFKGKPSGAFAYFHRQYFYTRFYISEFEESVSCLGFVSVFSAVLLRETDAHLNVRKTVKWKWT